MLKQILSFFFTTIAVVFIHAQADSTWHEEPEIYLSGFTDIFYAYNFNQPNGNARQSFLFNHNRHNEFNLNLGLIKLGIHHPKYRASLALQTGTYADDNYVLEPGLLKNIFEASIGISINKANNVWLDAGIFPSHIGFESALSTENMTLTRSLCAESSPYFLSGVKITYSPSDKIQIVGMIVNGWQRIQRLDGNTLPSFGTQVLYQPNDRIALNWSTYIGTDDPDDTRRMRYFNNFFGQLQLSDRFDLIAGVDIGLQQKSKNDSDYDSWFAPIVIGQYAIDHIWNIGLRAELFHDSAGVIIPTDTANGFQTTSLSVNMDYSPAKNVMCRIEGRWLSSEDNIFETASNRSNQNFTITTSIAVKFTELKLN